MSTGPQSFQDPTTGETAAQPAPQAPAAQQPAPQQPAPQAQQTPEPDVDTGAGRTAGVWVALILGAIVLIALLIFVIQNNVSTPFQYFGAEFSLPLGVAMLLAAVAGALVMALVGSVRMIQMSMTIRRQRKTLAKVQRVTG